MTITTQQTRDVHHLLIECWASVADAGPTFNQRWVEKIVSAGNEPSTLR